MAEIWTFIQVLVKYGPVIYEAIKRGANFIELQINLREFDRAKEKAKDDKDTSDLENVWNPKPKSDGKSPPR
jgi:uncharacterized phage-associated protein